MSSYYDMLREEALKTTKELRSIGVPTWIEGSIAYYYLTGNKIPHKDIDLYVPNFDYNKKVTNYFKKKGYIIVAYNPPHKIAYSNNRILYDVFYGTSFYGYKVPKVDYNSYTLSPDDLIDLYNHYIKGTKLKIENLQNNLEKHKNMLEDLIYRYGKKVNKISVVR